MDVGVRELKQHLSEYLRRVERGETIRITDRGRPKAVLMAIGGHDPLARGIDEGWVTAPARAGGLPPWHPSPGERRVLDVLADDRAES